MINSMTGFGSAKGHVCGLAVSIEIRSVNSRFLDLNLKLPRGFLFLEAPWRSTIQEHVNRGKIDLFMSIDSADSAQTFVHVNEDLAVSYHNALLKIQSLIHAPSAISALDIARMPEVLTLEKEELDQTQFCLEAQPVLLSALADYNRMRNAEGEKLKEDLLLKADTIASLFNRIEQLAPKTLQEYQNRLRNKLSELLASTDKTEEMILAEAALFADRIATDEELVRLHSHLAQFRSMLNDGSPIGRKLDFLVQEFNREANTIGSKCTDSDISYLVVALKSEIEKIREQIQNIE